MARGKMAARAANERNRKAQEEWDEKELRYKHEIDVLETEVSELQLVVQQLRNKLTREVAKLADSQVQDVRIDEQKKREALLAQHEEDNLAAGQFILMTLAMATELFGWQRMPEAAFTAMIAEFAELLKVSRDDLVPDGPWSSSRAQRRNPGKVQTKSLAEHNAVVRALQQRAHEVLFHSH